MLAFVCDAFRGLTSLKFALPRLSASLGLGAAAGLEVIKRSWEECGERVVKYSYSQHVLWLPFSFQHQILKHMCRFVGKEPHVQICMEGSTMVRCWVAPSPYTPPMYDALSTDNYYTSYATTTFGLGLLLAWHEIVVYGMVWRGMV